MSEQTNTNDPITQNAAAAAATPATGSPDQREARRVELTRELAGNTLNPKDRIGRLAELTRMVSDPEAVAKQDVARAERDAKTSPDERRRQELSRDPKYLAGDPEKVRQMRALIEKMGQAEEGAVPLNQVPLTEHREFYGLDDPNPVVLPKAWAEEYNREYGGHEQDFLVAARQHGLDSKLVGEMRDVGVRLAIEADGRPVSDEAWDAAVKRLAGRLTQTQMTSLRAWWKSSVEGGA